ncbi:MAG: restriction endonuclease subunit S [Bryobacteraceae bacterium]|nr:restriction endonuclease subunit S [Bryobacteraceae bacterium]
MAGEINVHTPSTAAELPSNWSWKRLDAVCEGVFDCPHSTPVLAKQGPYIVRSQDVRSGTFRADQAACVSEATYLERIARAEPGHGDLLYSREGTYFGIAAAVPPDVRVCLGQRMVLIRPTRTAIDFRYLRYWLNSPVMALHTGGHRDGSVAERLNLPTIRALPIAVPPLLEQRAIAHILGTLDDKIELNRRMNETLEAMARALFKSWFVNFDPVRAKAEGRDLGLPKPLADLFPESFEGSGLGEIPNGWRVGRFGDVVEQLRDQENPISSPEALYHHFSLPAFDDGQSPKAEYGERIRSQKSRVPAGVVLLSKLNPEIERVWLVDVRPAERAVCSTEFLVLRARPPFARSFIYCLARSQLFRQQIEGLVTGTSKSHQRAQADSILNLAVVVPPSSVVAAFDRLADNQLARTLVCRRESHWLAALRDTLLPKLVSGELPVPKEKIQAA